MTMKVSKKDISANSNYSDGKAFADIHAFTSFKHEFNKMNEHLKNSEIFVRPNSKLSNLMINLIKLAESIAIIED